MGKNDRILAIDAYELSVCLQINLIKDSGHVPTWNSHKLQHGTF